MTPRQSPRSILDADSAQAVRSRRVRAGRPVRARKSLFVALGAVAVASAALGGFHLMHPGARAGASSLASSPAGHVDVLIDGWSLATLGNLPVTADWGGGRTGQVSFSPVTADDLRELQVSSPALLQTVLAREVDGSTSLSCTSGGCTVGGKGVDVQSLLAGGNAGATALMRAEGVDSGLLKVRLFAPQGASSVRLSAPGYTPITLTAAPTGTESPAPADTGASAGDVLGVADGFGRGRWLVAAGLGQFFVPQAAWLGAQEERVSVAPGVAGELPQDAIAQVTALAPVVDAPGGLREPLAVAGSWTPSQLTLATSPTKGCTAGIVCFPGDLAPTQTVQPRQVVKVTSSVGQGVVVLDDRTITLDVPAPVAEVGVDKPLSGHVTVRMLTATLFAGSKLGVVDRAGLVDTADAATYTPAQVLEHVRLAGQTWTVTP